MTALVLAGLLSAPAHPMVAKGYVVKADGGRVWLDLTAADGAAPGRPFVLFAEGEELKHPVTGASLGRVEQKLGEGAIREVSEQFSMGELSAMAADSIKPGTRARLDAPAPAPAPAQPPALRPAQRPGDVELRAPKSRGATLPFEVAAMAVGDFTAAGSAQLALAAERSFHLYAYPAAENLPLMEGALTATGARIVSLEAADLDGDGRAELFVSVFNEPFKRFETLVFEAEAGAWAKVADLPWLVRAHQDPKGARIVASQQIQDDRTFPFASIYPLVYKDGRYQQGRPSLKPKRVDWLYSFTQAQLDEGDPALIYLTSVNSLRVQFPKGHWRSSDKFGQSPVRVRWNEKLLEFHPPMLASYGPSGLRHFYAVRNLAMLGGLATPFGLFNGGELHALSWTGVAFEKAWKAELGGASQGFALAEPVPGRPELIVAVTGSTGKSAVWIFDP